MRHEPARAVLAIRHQGGRAERREEMLAEETPVALVYNGRSHAVMMATPRDLDDFAYGFTLTEGIAEAAREIEIVDRLHTDDGIALQLLIPQRRFDALDSRDRNLTGRTGCGLCGAASLESAIRPVRRVGPAALPSRAELRRALDGLIASQPLNDASGAVHAAALIVDGAPLLIREDVGRHNAVDKVFGAALRQARAPRALLVTSRASYEIVHKAAQAGCALVAAISAPTALAVRIAEQAGVVLIGFARDDRLTVYNGALPVE